MSDENKKARSVLIGCPTAGGLDPDPNRWIKGLLSIIDNVRREGFSYAFLAPYRMDWERGNNQIWDTAFSYKFDYILRMDDDIWGIPDNAFSKLLEADKDVIGAAYPLRTFPYSFAAFDRTDKTKSLCDTWLIQQLDLREVNPNGIQPVDIVGFGLTLIKTEKFRFLERPMFKNLGTIPDDTYFAQKCLDNGIQQYVDFDVKMAHREVTPMNKLYLFNADARGLLQNGMIKGGNVFHDSLIEQFGADGRKDIEKIKGLYIPETGNVIS